MLSLGQAERAGFSLSPADNLAQQMPATCESRGGRFSVNCPGNKEILAMLLEMFAVHCTFFRAEYLPAIISSFYVLTLQTEACPVKSRRVRPRNRRDGVLGMIHSPGGGWWNMEALMANLVALLLRLCSTVLGAPVGCFVQV